MLRDCTELAISRRLVSLNEIKSDLYHDRAPVISKRKEAQTSYRITVENYQAHLLMF